MLVAERKRKKPKIASSQKYMTDENGQPLVDENGKLTKRYIDLILLLSHAQRRLLLLHSTEILYNNSPTTTTADTFDNDTFK